MHYKLGMLLLCFGLTAQATPYRPSDDPWYYDPGNPSNMHACAFSVMQSVLPTVNSNGNFDIAYEGVFGYDEVSLSAPGTSLFAQSSIGRSVGYASANLVRLADGRYWDGNGSFHTGWRDVWTVSGLEASSGITIRGHSEGFLQGWANLQTILNLQTFNNTSTRSAALGYVLTPGGGALQTCNGCSYTASSEGGNNRIDFSLFIPVSNGDKVMLNASLLGSTSSVYAPRGLIDGLHTSMIESITGGPGLVLTADSGQLRFDGSAYVYAVNVNAIPEPEVAMLLLAGLIAVAAHTTSRPGRIS